MMEKITADFLQKKSNSIEINKNAKTVKVALLGYRSIDIIGRFMISAGKIQGLDFEIYKAPYQQIETELFDSNSKLYAFKPEIVILLSSSKGLKKTFYTLSIEERESFHISQIKEIKEIVDALNSNLGSVPIVLDNFEENLDDVFGNFANKTRKAFQNQVRRLNVELMNLCENNSSIFLFDTCSIIAKFGSDNSKDIALSVNVDIPFNLNIEAKISWGITQIIGALRGSFRKCLILDLDNTIWGGEIGDDGLNGIQLESSGVGQSYLAIQTWAKELKLRGIILAVCSKNTASLAMEVFDKHPNMILRQADISSFKINWLNKADNIIEIRNELNIGFDSMVFVDDNPVERDLVRSILPDVLVPELPDDPFRYLDYLTNLNLFETTMDTDASLDRTVHFQTEKERNKELTSFSKLEEFLEKLKLKMNFTPFNNQNKERVSELSLRSNQFNLRTIRYTVADVEAIQINSDYHTYAISLEDKFGQYGIISCVVLKQINANTLFIENWLMSCRALQRGVEATVLNLIIDHCKLKKVEKLEGQYLETDKNGIVSNHYQTLGFKKNKHDNWEMVVEDYIYQKSHVQLI